jgi:predicted S18 family serine protease
MIEKVKSKSKLIFLLLIILLLTVAIFAKMTNHISLALSASEALQGSLNREVEANDWIIKKPQEGRVILKDPEAPTLSELLPAEQVTPNGLYISYADLISIPSLFCSAKL